MLSAADWWRILHGSSLINCGATYTIQSTLLFHQLWSNIHYPVHTALSPIVEQHTLSSPHCSFTNWPHIWSSTNLTLAAQIQSTLLFHQLWSNIHYPVHTALSLWSDIHYPVHTALSPIVERHTLSSPLCSFTNCGATYTIQSTLLCHQLWSDIHYPVHSALSPIVERHTLSSPLCSFTNCGATYTIQSTLLFHQLWSDIHYPVHSALSPIVERHTLSSPLCSFTNCGATYAIQSTLLFHQLSSDVH